jgi:hypothetical protein
MTVLSVIQEASSKLGFERPSAVFAETDRTSVELKDFVNEVAVRVAKAHDWRALSVLATYTGDGSDEDFDLPSDFDRMQVDDQVWTSTSQRPLSRIPDLNTWLGLDVQNVDILFGAWIIYGGQIHIRNPLANLATAKHWYQTNEIVNDNGGAAKVAFTADDDTFRLNERLLRLALIWEWKKDKGRPYAEDMATYEEAKEKLISADKGARKLIVGRKRLRADAAEYPFPGTITP